MGTIQQLNFQLLYNDARLASVGTMLDELHTAASDGDLSNLSPLSPVEMVAWLRELIYTAEETIMEIEEHATEPAGLVRVK
jgi:hypothetical protein